MTTTDAQEIIEHNYCSTIDAKGQKFWVCMYCGTRKDAVEDKVCRKVMGVMATVQAMQVGYDHVVDKSGICIYCARLISILSPPQCEARRTLDEVGTF